MSKIKLPDLLLEAGVGDPGSLRDMAQRFEDAAEQIEQNPDWVADDGVKDDDLILGLKIAAQATEAAARAMERGKIG